MNIDCQSYDYRTDWMNYFGKRLQVYYNEDLQAIINKIAIDHHKVKRNEDTKKQLGHDANSDKLHEPKETKKQSNHMSNDDESDEQNETQKQSIHDSHTRKLLNISIKQHRQLISINS